MTSLHKQLGFAIVGPGTVADFHRQAVEANADRGAHLVAIVHHDPARFDDLSAQFGVPCLTLDDALARDDVDVVLICTPSGQHAAQAMTAAEAGKHVLVEKPMALSLEDADAMVRACDEAGVTLGVTVQRRAEPVFQHIRRAIDAGALGYVTLGAITLPYYRPQTYYDQSGWRGTWEGDGGGVLMNQGIHLVDLLVWYMGDPVEVKAEAATLQRAIDVEDTLTAVLRFENGDQATITVTTTANPGFPHRIELYGTRGGIQVEGENVTRWALVDPPSDFAEPPAPDKPATAGAGADPKAIPPTGHINIVRDFIDAVRHDRAPLVDGAEGRRSLATVLAVYEAAGLLPPADTRNHTLE